VTTEIIISNSCAKLTWAEIVEGHPKPKRSEGNSNRFKRSTGTQMIDAIRKEYEPFSHTVEEIRKFCLEYLRVGKWTKKIWRNCSFPQFLRKSGVCDYLTIEERSKIGVEIPFTCGLMGSGRIPVKACLKYGRDRTDFYSDRVKDYAYLRMIPTTKIMHKICEDDISNYSVTVMNTVTGEIQKKHLGKHHLHIEDGRQEIWIKMSNLTGANLIVTLVSHFGKDVYKTLMPKEDIMYSDNRTCTICLEDVDPAGAFIPSCGHMFHVECMREPAYTQMEYPIFTDVRVNYKCTNYACQHTMMSPMMFKCPMCRTYSSTHV